MATYPLDYELGKIRTDRGEFIDKGNQRCDIRHPDYGRGGARCDGAYDDTQAILDAVADGIRKGVPVYFPAGSILFSSPITDSAGRVVLHFSGNTTLLYAGSANDWVLDFTQQYSEMHGRFLLGASATAADYTYNGIRFSGSASRCVVRGFPQLNKLKNALKFVTIYGCEVEIDISLCDSIGVDFDTQANSNTVWAKGITGRATLGTKGIRNDGRGNICKGQQLSEWTHAYYGESYSQGTIFGHFVEANTNSVELEVGASLMWDCANGLDKVIVAEGASLVTPYGRQHPAGFAHVPTTMLPTRSLSAYYPIHDTSTTLLMDFSGNGRTGIPQGSWASTTGPYGNALSLASGASIRIPVTAITYNGPWSVAVLMRSRTWGAGDINRVFTIFESSNTIAIEVAKDSYNLTPKGNGTSAGNFGDRKRGTDEWEWVCFGYTPAAGGTIYDLNPALLSINTFQSYTLSNPLTGTPTEIEVGGSANGTIEVASVAVWNGRVLSKTEMLHWCSQVVPPMIPAAVPVIGALAGKGATSVADGGTVAHGLGATPTLVIATASTTGEFVSVTALGATTFTVAIKKHDNSAGTTQTIYWQAFK